MPGAGAAADAVPAPALGRAAPARRRRHRARAEPGPPDRRRADDRARRDDPGAAARAAARERQRARHGAAPDHARPRRRRGHGRPPLRDVCGPDRRGGPTESVFAEPRHPYTLGLLRSRAPDRRAAEAGSPSIPGVPPPIWELPAGCPFRPRCPFAFDRLRGPRTRRSRARARGQGRACWADVREPVR